LSEAGELLFVKKISKSSKFYFRGRSLRNLTNHVTRLLWIFFLHHILDYSIGVRIWAIYRALYGLQDTCLQAKSMTVQGEKTS
jgi:hypothetical protein